MSYILDALRKADAERERGAVPGIHDQAIFNGVPQFGARSGIRPWVIWLVAAVALALLSIVAVLLWKMRAPDPVRPMGEGISSGRVSNVAPAIAPSNVPPTTAAAVAPPPVAPPSPSTTVATAPAARVETVKPAPVRKPKPAVPGNDTNAAATAGLSSAEPRPRADANANANAAGVPNAGLSTPAAAASPAVTVSRIYTMSELPEEIRRQVPNISVGGSMYSPVPANRILFINGTVFHEGDKLAPDLVLQQIRLKAAVLSFKDYRYLLNF
jgi:general secretion pathway protein B